MSTIPKILCVDDAEVIREQLKLLLEQHSFQVVCAASGPEGIEKAEKEDFQMVITDLNMPNMSGLEMIKEMRGKSAHSNIPFLVLTTDSTPELKEEGKKNGVFAWIIKPFNNETFIAAIKQILGVE